MVFIGKLYQGRGQLHTIQKIFITTAYNVTSSSQNITN